MDNGSSSLWNSEFARNAARRIASLSGVYCGPAAVAWIAAVWNAKSNLSYDYIGRLKDKQLFPDGPRTFTRALPGFQTDLDQTLLRETHGALRLSKERYYRYDVIHELNRVSDMPFIVRIPTASIRNGLHYVTLFKCFFAGETFTCYWQDNGVYKSDEETQQGISVSKRNAERAAFFPWGARQVIPC